ncbi:hypothetical protein [Streptomyces sp. NPDC005244]|uniref:hypothetical protein n=1 Tax=Streptomyces sp. NPDC005244 TaxID=3364708 RepID=UPI00368BC932
MSAGDYVLTPECRAGLCEMCCGPGPVYAPGKRAAHEVPIMTVRCDHGCSHKKLRAGGMLRRYGRE